MSTKHVVADGDCIESIAFLYGFSPDALWDHPENAGLRTRRDSRHHLVPGDEVFIPDLRIKTVSAMTGRIHRFRRLGVPAKIRLVIQEEGEPRAQLPYKLTIGDRELTGTTSEDGVIEHWISPSTTEGDLDLEGTVYRLKLGSLRPSGLDEGIRSRLENLGYGPVPDAGSLASVLRRFQLDYGLEATGEADDPTKNLLRELHDL